MTTDELNKYLFDKHRDEYGIMPPPITDKEFVDLIIEHFIPDYISVNPIGRSQFNTEALYMILERTQKKETVLDKIKSIFGGKK